MEHLQESRVLEYLWDGIPLSEVERGHLQHCSQCQAEVAWSKRLRDELGIALQSELSEEAQARLVSIIDQSRLSAAHANPLEKMQRHLTGWVQALPLWDSRQQSALGIRSGSRSTYRMLFGARETEVELMVEPHDGMLRIVGEVVVNAGEGSNSLALIELMTNESAKSAIEAESDSNGRFSLDRVPPGTYVLTITPRYSQMVVIESLELT